MITNLGKHKKKQHILGTPRVINRMAMEGVRNACEINRCSMVGKSNQRIDKKIFVQDGPLPVLNWLITPISRVIPLL